VPVLRAAYEHLARSMTLVLYDGRGMGSSDRRIDPNELGLDAHLRDLDAVVTAAGLETTALLGYYHSAATAIAFAAEHPRQVTRMVLFGGAARLRDAMSPVQTQALLSLVDQDWDLFADTAAHAWLGWTAGESGRLVAEGFRSAAAPGVAKASPTLFMADARGDLELVTRFLTGGDVVPPAVPATPPADGVTARELDVLRLLAAGESNASIARSLGITVHTVERHTANLYRKIGARGRADATAYALRRGIA
jgi:DNA-binding CsgD family transcriptional regulator